MKNWVILLPVIKKLNIEKQYILAWVKCLWVSGRCEYIYVYACVSACVQVCMHKSVLAGGDQRLTSDAFLNYCPPLFLRKGLSLKVGLADLVKISRTSWTAFFPSLLHTGVRTSRRHLQLFTWVLENKLRFPRTQGSAVITVPSCQLHVKLIWIIGFPLYGPIQTKCPDLKLYLQSFHLMPWFGEFQLPTNAPYDFPGWSHSGQSI